MRRISANYIFPVTNPPLKNGIVELNDDGSICSIIDTKGQLTESRNLEFYNGVIVPGFVNTHCHLELSELKGQVSPGLTIPGFISQMISYKKQVDTEKAIAAASFHDGLMQQNGIVAVADIVNSSITVDLKAQSKIYYHNLIELIGLGKNATDIFNKGLQLYQDFKNMGLSASMVPHAPYSVSEYLFDLLARFAVENNSILSIHNQESEAENNMFRNKKGELVDLFSSIGISLEDWTPTGKNSNDFLLRQLPKENACLFVHNLYSTKNEIEAINNEFKDPYFVLCPISNYYIENKYPELDHFLSFTDKVTIGTDSLASNYKLSILDEMKALVKLSPSIPFETILQWATINGARALKIDQSVGSLEINKKPGLNLISDFDFGTMQIREKSSVRVLV
ncbi:MAG: amidohydrolase family protein [Bacteroidales bacterium]|jgi:cytosine/adenosine deaminase-related metal-dependent hydrolase|nr:amidohydrolase family protein [Bacteroidales bacterium]